MPRLEQKMPALTTAPANGNTATFRLPIGRRFHHLYLLGSGTTFAPADISEIRILANNKPLQRFSGADRDVMNLFDGRAGASIDASKFNLTIPFDRYRLSTRAGDEETALNTGSVDPKTGKSISSLTVEIDLGSTSTGTLALEMYASTSEQLAGGPGTVPYILKSKRDYASATTYEWSDIPRGGLTSQFINRVFLNPSTGTLENLKVLANSYTVFERTAALNERVQRDGIRVPQGGWYCIDRTERSYAGDPFDVRQLDDFRIRFDTSGGMTVTSYTEYLGALGD